MQTERSPSCGRARTVGYAGGPFGILGCVAVKPAPNVWQVFHHFHPVSILYKPLLKIRPKPPQRLYPLTWPICCLSNAGKKIKGEKRCSS